MLNKIKKKHKMELRKRKDLCQQLLRSKGHNLLTRIQLVVQQSQDLHLQDLTIGSLGTRVFQMKIALVIFI